MKPCGVTLVKIINELRPNQQDYLVFAINQYGRLGYEIHRGVLPFINLTIAHYALDIAVSLHDQSLSAASMNGTVTTDAVARNRLGHSLRSKIRNLIPRTDWFATIPEGWMQGHCFLHGNKLRKAYPQFSRGGFGIKWSSHTVKLKPQKHGMWRVTAPSQVYVNAMNYLQDKFWH